MRMIYSVITATIVGAVLIGVIWLGVDMMEHDHKFMTGVRELQSQVTRLQLPWQVVLVFSAWSLGGKLTLRG